jgi:peroxiredoxin
MIKYIPFLLFIMMLVSCTPKEKRDTATVQGTFKGIEGRHITLSELKTQRTIRVDSVKVEANGEFRLSTIPSEKSFYLLDFGGSQPISIILDKGELIHLEMDTSTINQSYLIDANTDSRLLQAYFLKTGQTRMKIDSLRKVLFESRALVNFVEIKTGIDTILQNTLNNHKQFTENLIRNNPQSLATILLINQSFAGKQLFNIDTNLDLHINIDDSLMTHLAQNNHVKAHHERVKLALKRKSEKEKAEARLSPGKAVPELKLPDTDGNRIPLSKFKGKNVILFFWASYSPECRADIQQLKALYKKYIKTEKLEIYAVSFDHQEKFWKAAVEIENLNWVNVLDIYGANGPVSKLFNIETTLPYYFLIDEEGIIITKTEDFGELKDAVHELDN